MMKEFGGFVHDFYDVLRPSGAVLRVLSRHQRYALKTKSYLILTKLFIKFQVPAETEADLHRRRQEDADIRIQEPDAFAAPGNAPALVPRRRERAWLPPRSVLSRTLQFLPAPERWGVPDVVLPPIVPPGG